MEQFKSWEELSALEQAQCMYWDMYKDAYGVRPRGMDTSTWTLEDFDQEFASLGRVIEQENIARREAEARAIVEFEDRVKNLMHTGMHYPGGVVAWLMDAEHANGDLEYFAFTQGLPYDYFRKADMILADY
jgi:hypothetical protein